jgi:hypothetical protein
MVEAPEVSRLVKSGYPGRSGRRRRTRSPRPGPPQLAALLVLVVLAELYLAGDYLSAAGYALLLAPWPGRRGLPLAGPGGGLPGQLPPRGRRPPGPGGERRAAIVRAVADQLGLHVTEVKEFALEGSGGSSLCA